MQSAGRIVNVSSQAGKMKYFGPTPRSRFTRPDLTWHQIGELICEYKAAASKSQERQMGWPAMTYSVSKAALNAATRLLADENPSLTINCCCPGWVRTSLGGQAGSPPKTPSTPHLVILLLISPEKFELTR
jgi:carbonyl reductase 1